MAKISQLAGQINRKKNQQAGLASAPSHYHPYQRACADISRRDESRLTTMMIDPSHHHSASWHRGGYSPRGRPPTHRNRTLVLNGASQQKNSGDASSTNSDASSSTTWVTKSDRHLQLINTTVYEKETQARTRAIEQTRRHKQATRDDRERLKLMNHLSHSANLAASAATKSVADKYEIEIQGIRFVVSKNGSKLVKVPGSSLPRTRPSPRGRPAQPCIGDNNSPKATPKMAVVGGVKFYRSKNGNLYRHGIVKAQRYVTRQGSGGLLTRICPRQSGTVKKVNVPCKTFSTTGISHFRAPHPRPCRSGWALVGRSPTDCDPGSCPKGPRCRYTHDPSRVAVCIHFLQKGECFNGDSCDLSHDLTPQRTPTCLHYLSRNCTKPNCRYAHNKTSATALVCRPFGFYGYCESGLECPDRHVSECPDFSNTGTCKSKGCKLLHRERASVLRKANSNPATDEAEAEDLSSDEDGDSVDSYDVDSDEVDEFIGQDDSGDTSFVDQKDFIEL